MWSQTFGAHCIFLKHHFESFLSHFKKTKNGQLREMHYFAFLSGVYKEMI